MTEAIFYLLNTSQPRERYIIACRVAEKAYKLGERVFILTNSAEETRTLDNLLWSFKQGSFIPHVIVDVASQQTDEQLDNTVLIGTNPMTTNATVLINLSTDVPENIESYERIAEFIDQDLQITQAGRQRYKVYQSKNIPLKTHNL
jgi:DNA polymerase-3 subunit chi